jgi:hypothetical protein
MERFAGREKGGRLVSPSVLGRHENTLVMLDARRNRLGTVAAFQLKRRERTSYTRVLRVRF